MEKRKRGRKNPSISSVHIGKLLSEKIKERNLSHAEMARRIMRHQSFIKPLLSRPSMQVYVLWEISLAMEYDFFSDLSVALLQKNPAMKSAHAADKIIIASLEKELAAIKEQRDYLKKMIDIMAK